MPRSKAEVRLAHAVLEGRAKGSMDPKYAKEVVSKMHGHKLSALPEHASGSSAKIKGRLRQSAILLAVLLIPLAAPVSSWGQGPGQGSPTRVNAYPTSESPTQLPFYDGSNHLIYLCYAQPFQTNTNGVHAPTWAITPTGAQLTLTNIVVATNVATATVSGSTIKLQIGNKVVVAGSATTALNGSYAVATTPTSTTITFATSGVSDATYADATLTLASTAPRSDDKIWAIQKMTFTGNNVTLIQWADGSSGNYTHSCDARTTQIYQ